MSAGRLVGATSVPSESFKQSGPSGASQFKAQNRNVQLASQEEDEEEEGENDDRGENDIEKPSDSQQPSQQVETRHQSKLAGETKKRDQVSGQQAGGGDKRRPDGGPSEQHLTRAASVASERNQEIKTAANTKATTNSTAKQPGKKLGLLEALLGERGRNWFEHRTVILDIQNGKRKPADKSELTTKTSSPLTRAESYTKLDENDAIDKRQDQSNLIASAKVSGEDQETRLKKYSRLPTFGSIPQKLNSLSSATRREIEITRPQQTASTKEKSSAPPRQAFSYTKRASNIGRNSVASSRLSNLSSSSASSSQLTSSAASTSSGPAGLPARGGSQTTAPRPHANSTSSATRLDSRSQLANQRQVTSPSKSTGRRNSLLGFSNISNLFPGEPVRRRQRHQEPAPIQHNRSASLINLTDKRAYSRRQNQLDQFLAAGSPVAASAAEAARQRQRRIAQQHLPVRPASVMMRPRSGQHHSASVQRDSKASNYSSYQPQRLRPASATGNYLAAGGASARGRSPTASYRLGSAGMSPLVDPDCPVHGEPAPGGQRGRSYDRDDLFERSRYADYGAARSAAPGYYSSSQPDLMYAPEEDPYNIARPARDYPAYGTERTPPYAKGSPIYSPIDYDAAPSYAGRSGSRAERRAVSSGAGGGQQSGAYYNDSSRFSLYHASPDGGVRSSLAPTSEQLRRILGYRPQPLAKPVHLHPQWAYTRPFIHLQPAGSGFGRSPSPLLGEDGEPLESDEVLKFAPFNRLQDSQAIRAVDFHPSGEVYAIGSNSRALRICAYPAEHELRHFEPFERDEAAGDQDEPVERQRQQPVKSPRVLFKFLQLHRGSIYCVSFNPSGQLLATGSNDQTIHIAKYNSITHNPDGEEFRLTMHNGTVRDLCFIDDSSGNGSSLLLSAGGGDNKIYVTDCDTITPFQSMAGHTQMVMALNHCGGAQFVSGSYDKTIRFWDLRARSCTSIVSAPPTSAFSGTGSAGFTSGPGAPVCALRVDPSGRLLASGHTDTTCMLYDIRGGKIIQTFRPHDDEIRAISFSPKSYYLLTGGYDGRLVVSDLQGDLTQPLPSVCVAESQDKIVQAKWHPADFTFVSTSADKSATLWSLPGEIRN